MIQHNNIDTTTDISSRTVFLNLGNNTVLTPDEFYYLRKLTKKDKKLAEILNKLATKLTVEVSF